MIGHQFIKYSYSVSKENKNCRNNHFECNFESLLVEIEALRKMEEDLEL